MSVKRALLYIFWVVVFTAFVQGFQDFLFFIPKDAGFLNDSGDFLTFRFSISFLVGIFIGLYLIISRNSNEVAPLDDSPAKRIKEREKQKKIAIWILEHGFAPSDRPNTSTREELMKMFTEPRKEQLRKKLLKDYIETFGEPYDGDVIEDVFLDLKSKQALEKLAYEDELKS